MSGGCVSVGVWLWVVGMYGYECECVCVCVGVGVIVHPPEHCPQQPLCEHVACFCVSLYVAHNHVCTSSLVPGGMAVECIHQ